MKIFVNLCECYFFVKINCFIESFINNCAYMLYIYVHVCMYCTYDSANKSTLIETIAIESTYQLNQMH